MNCVLVLCIAALFGLSNAASIDYNVDSCILASIDAKATITIGGNVTERQNIDGGNGKCDPAESTLEIPFEQNTTLLMNFNLTDGTAYLSTLSLKFSDGVNIHDSYADLGKELSKEDQFYACDNPETYDLKSDQGSVSLTINSIKIQAFGIKGGKYSNKKKSCDALVTSTISTSSPTDTTETSAPTTGAPTTKASTTGAPTTGGPTTGAPTTGGPTTRAPTAKPATNAAPVNASVKDPVNGQVCLLIKFTGTLAVKFVNTSGKNDTYTYSIAEAKNVNGTCGNETERVDVTLMNGWTLSFSFSKTQKTPSRRLLAESTYYMSEVELTYTTLPIPNAKPPHTTKKAISESTDRNKANIGQSYRCKALEDVVMNDVTLSTTDFQAEAFRDRKTLDFAANPQICNDDMTDPGNLVPIIVGVVLALLVLVIIIAYLIGRRRNQSGYQSV